MQPGCVKVAFLQSGRAEEVAMTGPAANRVRTSRDGALLHVVLAAPGHGNTIDLDFTVGLAAALADLADVRCIALTAEGSNFCLGGDIGGFAAARDPGGHVDELARDLHENLLRLDTAGVPVVVGVQGWAAGAGLGLVLAADIAVLERSARLRTAYTAIGLSPDGGVSWRLPLAVGTTRAMDLLLTNRPMDAEEALAAGLASRIVETGRQRRPLSRSRVRSPSGPPPPSPRPAPWSGRVAPGPSLSTSTPSGSRSARRPAARKVEKGWPPSSPAASRSGQRTTRPQPDPRLKIATDGPPAGCRPR
jgi:2-(1,2-epoxy-1,2-dihydrophenyl)acetyl-CoA isomerase